jgi:hypothetical protein
MIYQWKQSNVDHNQNNDEMGVVVPSHQDPAIHGDDEIVVDDSAVVVVQYHHNFGALSTTSILVRVAPYNTNPVMSQIPSI